MIIRKHTHRESTGVLFTITLFLTAFLAARVTTASSGVDSDGQAGIVAPRVEVTRSVFSASRNCRLLASRAADCPDPKYTTFKMRYTVGSKPEWGTWATIRISFGYRYKGAYRLERAHSRPFAWARPQLRDRSAPNYITLRLLNNPGPTRWKVRGQQRGQLVIALAGDGEEAVLAAGAVVEITYGDTLGGSPGYLVPPIAYDVDLIVEQDTDHDGNFEVVDAAMPTLRVIGTKLDGFDIIAPSTPDSGTFRVIVKAMQGRDEPKSNMYLVQNYTGTITFASSDPAASLPADYRFRPEDRGVRSFQVALGTRGVQWITVREQVTGQSGRSNPILLRAALFSANKPGRVPPVPIGRPQSTDRELYWGVLHQHTNIGGHAGQTPEFAYNYARNVSRLDFFALSEHCEDPHFDWYYHRNLAESYNVPGEFITIAANEWTSSDYGHRHVLYLDPFDENSYCSKNRGNPTTRVADTLEKLFDVYRDRDVMLLLHHTGWRYAASLRDSSADDVVLGDVNYRNQPLFEIYSHHGSSERYDNAPYTIHGHKSHQWGPEKKVYFQDALALGYKFGITADGDDHMGKPGGHVANARDEVLDAHYSRLGLTAVYASSLTRKDIWEALRSRRTYGTTGARIVLDFAVNGAVMGEEKVIRGAPLVEVGVIGTDTLRTISVIRNGYETVFETSPGTVTARLDFVDADVRVGRTYSYYVRVVQNDDHHAWTSPIWVTVRRGRTGRTP